MSGSKAVLRPGSAPSRDTTTRYSLRFWLVVLIAALALPLILLAAITTTREHAGANRRLEHQLQLQAQALAMAIEGRFVIAATMAETLAASVTLANEDLVGFRGEMDAAASRAPGSYISLADRFGMQRILTYMPPGTYPPPDTQASAATVPALRSGQTQFSNLYRGALTGMYLVAVSAPVKQGSGVVSGVVNIGYPSSQFDQVLRQQGLPNGWVATLFDRDFRVVARSERADEFIGRSASHLFITEGEQKAGGVVELTRLDGVPSSVVYARAPMSRYTVGLGVPTTVFEAPLRRALLRLSAISLALTLGGLGIAIWLGNRIAGAIEGLLRSNSRRASGLRFREIEDIAFRLASQERAKDTLIGELNHRVKNTLMTVQSLAAHTVRSTPADPARFQKSFNERLAALARAHDLLARHSWQSVGIQEVLNGALEPWQCHFGSSVILRIEQDMQIEPKQAQALVMSLNELATNAVGYGALSVPSGHVSVACGRTTSGMVSLRWTESGGPAVDGPPNRQGLGLRFINRILPADLGRGAKVTMAFNTTGVEAVFAFWVLSNGQQQPAT